jgi:hypothetical protein
MHLMRDKNLSCSWAIYHISNPTNISCCFSKHRWKCLSSAPNSVTNNTTGIPTAIFKIE